MALDALAVKAVPLRADPAGQWQRPATSSMLTGPPLAQAVQVAPAPLPAFLEHLAHASPPALALEHAAPEKDLLEEVAGVVVVMVVVVAFEGAADTAAAPMSSTPSTIARAPAAEGAIRRAAFEREREEGWSEASFSVVGAGWDGCAAARGSGAIEITRLG